MAASSLLNVINYVNSANFNFDSNLIDFNGSLARLKLQNAPEIFTEDFADGTGFTFNSSLAEFAAGVLRQKDQTATGSIFAATYASSFDQIWNKVGGSLTATLNGVPTLSGGKLVCTGVQPQGLYYNGTTADIETHRFRYTPNYTGGPSTNRNIASGWNGTNNNNRWNLTNSPSGDNLRFTLFNASGGTVITVATLIGGSYSPTAGVEQIFEVVLNATAGTVSLYINGSLHGTLSPGAWTRGSTATRYYLGASPSIYDTANASFRDYQKFNSVALSGGSYTIAPFIYAETSADLPAFTHALLGTFLSYTSLAVTEVGSPRYQIKTGAGAFKYWNGSMWTGSDGTYAQSNTLAVVNANLAALTDALGATSVTIRVVFPNANTISSSDNLVLTVSAETAYPTSNPSIVTNSGVLADALESFEETVSNVSGSDDLRYTIVVNDQDKYWDGSAWSNSDGTYAQANTPDVIQTNAAALDIELGVTLKVRVFLHSDDSQTTPEIETVTLGYNFFSVVADPPTCTVFGFYKDVSGVPVVGATVTFALLRSEGQYKEAGGIIIEKSVSTITDANGRFEVDLIRSSAYEGSGVYLITIVKSDDSLETSKIKSIGSVGLEFNVPDSPSVDITSLLTAA